MGGPQFSFRLMGCGSQAGHAKRDEPLDSSVREAARSQVPAESGQAPVVQQDDVSGKPNNNGVNLQRMDSQDSSLQTDDFGRRMTDPFSVGGSGEGGDSRYGSMALDDEGRRMTDPFAVGGANEGDDS